MRRTLRRLALVPLLPALAAAQQACTPYDLALQLQNPVADLLRVPLQADWDTGIGVEDASRLQISAQPVLPVSLDPDWNLISRTFLPFIDAEAPAPGAEDAAGLGDLVQSVFLSLKEPSSGGWITGFGPVLAFPTASEHELGTGKWSAGPTAVALRQDGAWTWGLLANHLWSYAGPGNRADVNATFLQPFVAYTFPSATTLGADTESTYDWNADEWSVPVDVFASQVLEIGRLPVSLTLGYRRWAESPDPAADWGLRFGLTLVFPK
jgi:hypothetical protein